MDLCQHSQTLHVRCDTDMFVRLASLPLLASDWLELTQRSSEHTKTWCLYSQEWNLCGTLLGRNKSFSAYPLMTLPVQSAVLRMVSIFARVESVRCSYWAQRFVFRLPPYDTPHVERCNKDEFHIHHRYAAGGVCEQRMTALHNYIDRYCMCTLPKINFPTM